MNPVADTIAGIFRPIADVLDHVLPSGDARLQLQQKLIEGQIAAGAALMSYEQSLLDGQVKIIAAEAAGNSWLQRSWRPITMITFLVLVVFDSFGWLPSKLAPQAWTLLQLGLGGYVAGRSLEKIVPAVANVIKSKNGS